MGKTLEMRDNICFLEPQVSLFLSYLFILLLRQFSSLKVEICRSCE
jgi:hypothetical protein